jgi:bifunctional non-homologous end joining protein LigD
VRTISPMQPKGVATLPVGRDWTYEVKWDGYRALAAKDGRSVRLLSRTQTDLTTHFSRVAGDVGRLSPKQLVLDGELVALDATGRPSFQGLQEWYRGIRDGPTRPALAYYAFDVLEINGENWMARPLHERRRRLASLIRGESSLLLSKALPGCPADIEQRIRKFKLEGIVAKRRASVYRPEERSPDWVKVRFSPRQEFVVGGYRANGTSFDSVLVGYYSEGELRYAGAVRAGFTKRSRSALMKRWAIRSVSCPFVDLPHHSPTDSHRRRHPWDQRLTTEDMATYRCLPPSEVIEVAFLEWGRHGLLRDARFLGVRNDKIAHAVVREGV